MSHFNNISSNLDTNILTENSTKVLDSIQSVLKIDHEKEKRFVFDIQDQRFTYFYAKKNKDLLYSVIIAKGEPETAKDITEIVIAFPFVALEQIENDNNPETISFIEGLKKIYLSEKFIESVYIPFKQSSTNKDDVKLISEYLFPKDISDQFLIAYLNNLDNVIGAFESRLKFFNESYKEMEKDPKLLKRYRDAAKENYLYRKVQNDMYTCYFLLTDSHSYFILFDNDNEDGIMQDASFKYINLDDYFEYDENNNPLHEFNINANEIFKKPDAFFEWLQKMDFDITISMGIISSHYNNKKINLNHFFFDFSQANSYLKKMGFKEEVKLKTSDDFFEFNLNYNSKKELIGSIFLSGDNFKWENGFVVEENGDNYYPKHQKPLREGKGRYVSADLSYSNGLLLKVPKNANKEYFPILRLAFKYLKEKQYKNVSFTDKQINKLEKKLKSLGVLNAI